jgi:transcription elongation factor Elf1
LFGCDQLFVFDVIAASSACLGVATGRVHGRRDEERRVSKESRRTSMSLQNATPAVFAFARYFTRPLCPECGHEQFVPERSAFIAEGSIRHAWLCESCGHEFRTLVELGALAA